MAKKRPNPREHKRLRWTVRFLTTCRKASVDLGQAGNYFVRGDYPRAFSNVEKAAERCVVALRALKAEIEADSEHKARLEARRRKRAPASSNFPDF